jgi:hypothetical protein
MSRQTSSEESFASGPVCQGPSSIVFAWALDAPKLVLPKDVAFKLGGKTKIKYLVLQVHYASVEKFISKLYRINELLLVKYLKKIC